MDGAFCDEKDYVLKLFEAPFGACVFLAGCGRLADPFLELASGDPFLEVQEKGRSQSG